MADLFNIIRANLERNKPKDSQESVFGEPTSSRFDDRSDTERPISKKSRREINLEDLIIGEDERRYKDRENKVERKTTKDLDMEVGKEKDKPNVLSTIERVNFVKLDQLPVKSQIKEMKREYLNLLDALEDANKQIDSLTKSNSNQRIELQQLKKEVNGQQHLIRTVADNLPDGVKLKKLLEATNWSVTDIENELMERMKFLVDRVKNVEVYVEKQAEAQINENKIYKKKLIQYEAEFTKLEERYNQAVDHINVIEPKLQDALGQVEVLKRQTSRPNVTPEFHPIPPTKPVEQPKEEPVYKPAPEQRSKPKPAPKPVIEKKVEPYMEVEVELEPEMEMEMELEPEMEIEVELPVPEPVVEPPMPKFERFDRFETQEEEPTVEEVAPQEEEDEAADGHILLEIDRYLENLPNSHKLIIQVIGEHGVSRNQELREILEADPTGNAMFFKGKKFSYQDMSANVKTLRDGGFLDAEKVKLGSRGGYNFTVYELTSLGKAIYKALTNKKAVVSEKKLITNQHASLEHGFLIKDCAQVFKEMDYTVYTDRKDLTVKLPDGRRKDFDIIIEKDGNKQYIEVERGTHTDEDFFDAMDRIYQVTNEFYFIAPNEEKLFGKTKIQVFKWIKERLGGMDKAKGKITVHFATYEKVKKKLPNPWETIKL